MTINKAILLGNVGKDPEIRTTQSGEKIATISLATSESWKDKNSGEWKNKTEWHRVVVFNDALSGFVQNNVVKGSKIYVEGQLQTRKWTDQQGQEKYTTEIVLQKFGGIIKLISGGKSQSDSDSAISDNTDLDDEIPF